MVKTQVIRDERFLNHISDAIDAKLKKCHSFIGFDFELVDFISSYREAYILFVADLAIFLFIQ